jgi:glycerol-3-phosphate O-acyltransferase/dihydroxyacetone phosphate acyltransferase
MKFRASLHRNSTFAIASNPRTVNIFLLLFYHFLKVLVTTASRLFYRRSVLVNMKYLQRDAPCIVVSNHPSTLLDPFNVVTRVRREVFFLANASLFKTSFTNWFLNTFYCIPVERYQDTGGKPLNNEQAFQRSIDFLAKGGRLYVAPEGSSIPEQRLRPVKTGTARIALQAEAAHNFQLQLYILPVGLTYSNPRAFRATMRMEATTPIRVADYEASFRQDSAAAVRELTQAIHEGISSGMIDTENQEEERLLRRLHALLQHSNPLPEEEAYQRLKQQVLPGLRKLAKQHPAAYQQLENGVRGYFRYLQQLGLSDAAVARPDGKPSEWFQLLAGAPLALYGWLNHVLSFPIPGWVNRRFNRDASYESTFQFVTSWLVFPLAYALQISLVAWLSQSAALTWAYALSLLPSGLWTERYLHLWRQARARRHYRRKGAAVQRELEQQRAELLLGARAL